MHIELEFNENVKLVVHCDYKAGKPARVNRMPEDCYDEESDEIIFGNDDIYMLVRTDREEAAIVSAHVVALFYDELIDAARKTYKEQAKADEEDRD